MEPDKNYTRIELLCGEFLNSKDPYGKMDPYIKMSCGPHNFLSTTKKGAGLHAIWNREYFFLPTDDLDESRVKIEAWDWDLITANDLIGQTSVSIEELESKVSHEIPISKNGLPEGHIRVMV